MPSRPVRLLLTGALCAATALPAAAEAQRRDRGHYQGWIDTTFAFERGGIVDAEQLSGDIVVTTWDRAEVRVRAYAERAQIESTLGRTRVWLRLPVDEGRTDRDRRTIGDSRFEITVPAGVRVKTTSLSGNTVIRGTQGEVEAVSMSGDIEVRDAATVSVTTMSGDVELQELSGGLTVRTASGDVSVRGVAGELRAASVSGDLSLSGLRSRTAQVRTTSGDVHFDGSLASDGRYEFVSHSGDVRLRLGEEPSAEMQVETFSGTVHTDFTVTLDPNPRRTRRNLEFTLGRGGARVTVQTFSGDVLLQRGSR